VVKRGFIENKTVQRPKEAKMSIVNAKVIGWVAMGGYGYSVEKSIIYTYIPIEYSQIGTKLKMEFFGEQVGAVVVQSTLWDPKRERIKS
jgi:glycine cleavage system aminomethyltransferase T